MHPLQKAFLSAANTCNQKICQICNNMPVIQSSVQTKHNNCVLMKIPTTKTGQIPNDPRWSSKENPNTRENPNNQGKFWSNPITGEDTQKEDPPGIPATGTREEPKITSEDAQQPPYMEDLNHRTRRHQWKPLSHPVQEIDTEKGWTPGMDTREPNHHRRHPTTTTRETLLSPCSRDRHSWDKQDTGPHLPTSFPYLSDSNIWKFSGLLSKLFQEDNYCTGTTYALLVKGCQLSCFISP